jgi:hypothetical protein
MPKPIVLIAGAVVTVGVVAGVVLMKGSNKETTNNTTSGNSNTAAEVAKKTNTALDDPEGVYDLFSDPSVTKHPENDVLFGDGQTLTFEYDGSKTNNDPYATLSYQLYYIQENGKVQPMGGGNVVGEGGKGTFTVSDSVFNSSAKDRSGFLELQGTYDASLNENGVATGKNVTLGMYSVKFDVSD